MISIGVIARRVVLHIEDGDTIEMSRDAALRVIGRMILAVRAIDSGASVKDNFAEFMAGFSA